MASDTLAEIRRLQAKGWSQTKIGAKLGCSQSNVNNILKRAGLTKPATRRTNMRHDDPNFTNDGFSYPEPYRIYNDRVRAYVAKQPYDVAHQFMITTVRETIRKGRHRY